MMHTKSFGEIKAFTLRQEPFFCKDIKEVLKENDALMRQIIENEARSLLERAEYISVADIKYQM